ncbi:MAG: M1 family aminopeptidase [Vicinamibacterales bacterium]
MIHRLLLAVVLTLLPSLHGTGLVRPASAQEPPSPPGAAAPPAWSAEEEAQGREFLRRVEQIVQSGSVGGYLALLAPDADRPKASAFAVEALRPGADRVVVKERDRLKVERDGEPPLLRLVIDTFAEYGDKARVGTWLVEVEPSPAGWFIRQQESLSSVEQLYRLSLARSRQFDGTNAVVRAEDLTITLSSGTIFTIETEDGTTGVLMLGAGELRFAPTPETEKGQVQIFVGADEVVTRFDSAYVRFGKASDHLDLASLRERPLDPRLLKRAEQVFRTESAKSYILDLGDLSRDAWSLLPGDDDFLAEVRTKKLGTLTYARAWNEPEDVAFFERRNQRNISVYASAAKLAARGRFYDEDDPVTFDVVHYDIDLTMHPDRLWIEGTAQMRLRMKTTVANQLTLKLADSLVVHSVVSDLFGRLFALRVKGQDTILVNLPMTLRAGSELMLTIDYAGRLEPQPPNRETVQLQGYIERDPQVPPDIVQKFLNRTEPSFLYSNRSYWYPQSTVTDFATAVMHITVPSPYVCVASGTLQPQSPTYVTAVGPQPGRLYRFRAERPVRYLSFAVSRFERIDTTTLDFPARLLPASTIPERLGPLNVVMRLASGLPPSPRPLPPVYTALQMSVESGPRHRPRAREYLASAAEAVRYYDSIIGDIPYESFTMALTEEVIPGGHSPGYFAVLNQPLPHTGSFWSEDPAAFDNFPEFFIAHEVAHQWWGQAIGWRNYHEQWLSEGFSQYFAAMYAGHLRGPDAFASVLERMRRTAIEMTPQGPVYLGYRLGHIFNDGRVHRALVYNKGGAVLHMLRRLVGDEAFFKGLRQFYADWRYRKAGTEDVRAAMEAASGRSLERFFDRWIHGSSLPAVGWRWRVEGTEGGQELVVHVEQTGDVFDFALPLTLEYEGRETASVAVPVTDREVDVRIPLAGPVKSVEFDKADGALFEPERLP